MRLKILPRGNDNLAMRQILFALILASSTTIMAEEDFVFREASNAPEVHQEKAAEGSEIDDEIQKYFSRVKTSGLDLDQKRLDKIFTSDLGNHRPSEATPAREEDFSFQNMGDPVSHRVAAKETIYAISKKYGMKPDELIRLNPELASRPLYIGEDLIISNGSKQSKIDPKKAQVVQPTYAVRRGDNLSTIARRFGTTVPVMMQINGMKPNSMLREGMILRLPGPPLVYRSIFVWPVQAPITSYFGRRYNPFLGGFFQFHKGLDLGAVMGTKFRAARDGIVIYSGRMDGYGNCIFVRHAMGLVTVYGHNKLNLVKQGDVVRQGQVIGEVGRTGAATGPHLHFEVRKQEIALNPLVALTWKEALPPGSSVALSSRGR